MRYLATTGMAKEIDRLSINDIGIPSVVLMERAAMAVVSAVCQNCSVNDDIIILCGNGNNGADAIACGRQLKEIGYNVKVLCLCGENGTDEFNLQLKIAKRLGVSFITDETFFVSSLNVVIDGIFGIGLKRPIEGNIKRVIEKVNKEAKKVFAIDVPSGISADGKKVSDCIVKADYTITFGTNKLGLVIGNNLPKVGEIIVADIGFPAVVLDYVCEEYFYYEEWELKELLPSRRPNSNKGTYGKVLCVCGNKDMCGAAILCAKAAYKAGAGMVKVLSHRDNRNNILQMVPEALFATYSEETEDGNEVLCIDNLKRALEFASLCVIGCGLGTDKLSMEIFDYIVTNSKCNLVIDADGINILAKYFDENKQKAVALMESLKGRCVITPHIVEMARLTGQDKEFVADNQLEIAKELSKEYNIVTVLKNHRSIVSDGNSCYVNIAGNNGMATAGTGDVLAGIIGAFIAQGKSVFEGACVGAFVHGLAGDLYVKKYNRYSLMAGDLIDSLEDVL